ncbi:MAG: YraN family protein [Proteiniphilum sp.]|nr:YraN family protein [Proteiniphilum sp.]
MAQHNELGKKGEDEAVRYLLSEGYKITNRNWRFHGFEIDVVAEIGEFIVFAEVKTRTSVMYGNPEDFVSKGRRKRMVEAANHYLIENEIDKPARFDIIGIVWDGKKFSLDHIEDAFLPELS